MVSLLSSIESIIILIYIYRKSKSMIRNIYSLKKIKKYMTNNEVSKKRDNSSFPNKKNMKGLWQREEGTPLLENKNEISFRRRRRKQKNTVKFCPPPSTQAPAPTKVIKKINPSDFRRVLVGGLGKVLLFLSRRHKNFVKKGSGTFYNSFFHSFILFLQIVRKICNEI
jgi:hypothetical protein